MLSSETHVSSQLPSTNPDLDGIEHEPLANPTRLTLKKLFGFVTGAAFCIAFIKFTDSMSSREISFLISGIAFVIGFGTALFSSALTNLETALHDRGVRTLGRVTLVKSQHDPHTIRYRTPQGVFQMQPLSCDKRVMRGVDIEVVYLPERPERCMLVGQPPVRYYAWTSVVIILFSIGMALVGFFS